MRLVEQVGHIDTMPYDLMLKTLDHIEIGVDASIEMIFLAGIIVHMGDSKISWN